MNNKTMKLKFIEAKCDDNYYYDYYEDSQGRKQGEMRIYFSDENGDKSDKLHAIVNFKNDKYVGEVRGYDSNGLNFLECFFNENSKLHDKCILRNDKGVEKIMTFDNGERTDIKSIFNQ
jgi:antitoxin component YwqK of YwqJK toxin-antitoxin module